MRKKKVSLYRLDDYGLTIKKLAGLGNRPVDLHAYLKFASYQKLFPFPAPVRKKKIEEWRRKTYALVRAEWPSGVIKRMGSARKPTGIRSQIAAEDVLKILKIRNVDSVWIDKIQGLRKRKNQVTEKSLFAVEARFTVQVEGYKKGLQTYEDRIVIVKALDDADAEKRLMKEFREYGEPYLNPYGEMVRWHFERILDVYKMYDDKLDPNGTEVFSRLKHRRMKPEYEWHPLKEKKK